MQSRKLPNLSRYLISSSQSSTEEFHFWKHNIHLLDVQLVNMYQCHGFLHSQESVAWLYKPEYESHKEPNCELLLVSTHNMVTNFILRLRMVELACADSHQAF